MGVIEHSVEEEPLIKKVKMTDNEVNGLENSSESTTLSQKESGVDVNTGNEQSPLLDTEVNKETCVPSGDGMKKNDDLCSVAVEEEGKDIGVELSLAESKNVEPSPGTSLEMEEKEVDVVSSEVNIEKLLESELEKNDGASALVSVANKDEIPVIEKKDLRVASSGTEEQSGSDSSLKSSLVSRKKLLVLDLNGLLADIVSIYPDCKADINIGRRAIFKRPFCEDFLKFCFEKFEVGIWSSRKRTNVERIAAFLLGDSMSKLLFCWDMSYCTTTTVGSLENRYKVVVFKDLNRLWEKHDSRLPWKKGDYNETNTVLLDDSPYKALLNPPYTAIFPHSYTHLNTTDTALGDGGDLRLHLEKLVEAENVQEFIKNNPFGQEAITEASESWEFYRQAIHLTRVSSSHTNTHRF